MRVYLGTNNFRELKPITIMAESMAHLNNHRKHNSLGSLDCSLKFDILISYCQWANAMLHPFISEDVY